MTSSDVALGVLDALFLVNPGNPTGSLIAGTSHLFPQLFDHGISCILDITYDTSSFSINYKDSVNLDYDAQEKTIHSNYNGWIRNLEKAIRAQVSVL